jgi:hypothetical protein
VCDDPGQRVGDRFVDINGGVPIFHNRTMNSWVRKVCELPWPVLTRIGSGKRSK